jgi:uncharacterized membrane protein
LTEFLGVLAAFAYFAGSVVCHQIAERSFVTAGRQWPICARCAGIYLGVAVGFAAWLLVRAGLARRSVGEGRVKIWRPAPGSVIKILSVVAVPTLVSWGSGVLGIWDGTNTIRFMLAAPLGITAGAIAAAVAAKDLR